MFYWYQNKIVFNRYVSGLSVIVQCQCSLEMFIQKIKVIYIHFIYTEYAQVIS